MARVGVSLAAFVNFAAASGSAKAGQVQKAKRQAGGDGFDYWLALRSAIVAMHQFRRPIASLSSVLQGLNESRVENYTTCIAGYKEWLKRKKPVPFPTGTGGVWNSGDLTVRVNPELALDSGTETVAIKLYFGGPVISKARLELSHHLIRKAVGPAFKSAVLDVRRAKLHISQVRSSAAIDALFDGEARLFLAMWDSV